MYLTIKSQKRDVLTPCHNNSKHVSISSAFKQQINEKSTLLQNVLVTGCQETKDFHIFKCNLESFCLVKYYCESLPCTSHTITSFLLSGQLRTLSPGGFHFQATYACAIQLWTFGFQRAHSFFSPCVSLLARGAIRSGSSVKQFGNESINHSVIMKLQWCHHICFCVQHQQKLVDRMRIYM